MTPKSLGEKAMATRKQIMAKYGWCADADADEHEWKAMLETMLRSCPRMTLAEFATAFDMHSQTLRNDVCLLHIVSKKKKSPYNSRGWKNASPLREYSRRTGVSYSTLYSRYIRYSNSGMSKADAQMAAMTTDVKSEKRPRSIDAPDVKKMTHEQRERYILRLAKKRGKLRTTPKPERKEVDLFASKNSHLLTSIIEDDYYDFPNKAFPS